MMISGRVASTSVVGSSSSVILVLRLAIIGSVLQTTSSQRQINGVASPGNYIHTETDVDMSADLLAAGGPATININSPVPVTIQRFSDNNSLEGQQPCKRHCYFIHSASFDVSRL